MAAGLFDDLAEEITNTAKQETKPKPKQDKEKPAHRRTAPPSESQQTEDTPKKAANPPAARRGAGRPRSAQNRVSFTVKPLASTKARLQEAAVAHGTTASDIIDRLTARYLDELEKDM